MHDEAEGSSKTEVGYEHGRVRVEDQTQEDLKVGSPIKSQREREIKEELRVPRRAEVENGIKARGPERRDEAEWVGILEQLQKKRVGGGGGGGHGGKEEPSEQREVCYSHRLVEPEIIRSGASWRRG